MVATEVSAANSIFHIVVDTDATASKILSIMIQRSMPGRVTFLPLNKLRPRVRFDCMFLSLRFLFLSQEQNYPGEENNCLPLVNKLTYDPHFEAAVRHVCLHHEAKCTCSRCRRSSGAFLSAAIFKWRRSSRVAAVLIVSRSKEIRFTQAHLFEP